MRALLVNRFGFREADVVQLLNGQATAEAIRREVGALVRGVQALPSAGPPAQLMIHYSGHGALAPDQPPGDPDHDEDDGLDETILPYDADPISYDRDIRDDEINDWLKALWDGGKARVWVVLDSCHSGAAAAGRWRSGGSYARGTRRPDGLRLWQRMFSVANGYRSES